MLAKAGWERIAPGELSAAERLGLEVLGTLILTWRRACGLSQRKLAALAGVNQSTISRLENGLLGGLRLKTLVRIVGVLHDPSFGQPFRSRSKWA